MSELGDVGGTPGGLGTFLAWSALAAVSGWFFVDSVRVTSYGNWWISGNAGGSAGVVFLPLAIGIVGLFYDAKKVWPWIVAAVGVAVLGIEVLSRLQVFFNLKLSHLLIMMISFFAGIGLILRSVRAMNKSDGRAPWQDAVDQLAEKK